VIPCHSTAGGQEMHDEPSPPEAIAEERRRVRELRATVDLVCNVIAQSRLSRHEAEDLVGAVRRRALELFPNKGDTFDLILAPRFARLVEEFTTPERPPARVLAFRRAPPHRG
jgi:hypothetical protein